MRKKLPIGIQTFRKIREDNYVYVDKTDIAVRLIESGSYYFLSRPRRFGKSLFLDTLAEIFKGTKELFEGLEIYDKWDWSRKYPVIKLNLSSGSYRTDRNFNLSINHILDEAAELLNINISDSKESPGVYLSRIIQAAYKKFGKPVVILVDEYDKPIIDNITNKKQATENRNRLADFYSTIKASDSYIRFVMLTGVSKFSKVNLFSNLNNLEDITIDKNYATITGYTQNNLEECFIDYLEGVNLKMVKKWYNGYNYFGDPVYNPYDILLFFSKDNSFRNYWWETGSPSFLIEQLKAQQINYHLPELENITVTEETLNAFDVDKIDLTALLWQTGYLTFDKQIINKAIGRVSYKLKIPNLEIQCSLNALFLDYLTDLTSEKTAFELATSDALYNGDPAALETSIKSLFAAIPYSNYARNIIADYEGYYSSVLFTHIASIGYDLIPEDITNKGRIDLTVKVAGNVFIFEFKVDSSEPAIKQIKERRYYEKYTGRENPAPKIFLIGINFSSEEKNIEKFEWELMKL